MFEYFTKEEIEAKLSKIESCGSVIADLKKGDDIVMVMYGSGNQFTKESADGLAKKLTGNTKATAFVDCTEGMLVFPDEFDREEYISVYLD